MFIFICSRCGLNVAFSLPRHSVVCTVESLSLAYVLGDLSCETNIYVSLSTLELRERLVPLNMFEPFSNPFQGGASFVDPFCHLCFMFVFLILTCLFLAALWSPAAKGLTSWLSCVWSLLVFLVSTLTVKKVISKMKSDKAAGPPGKATEMLRPRGYKTWVQSQTQNKAQWLAACGHLSASSQSLRFILRLRMISSFITSRPGPGITMPP